MRCNGEGADCVQALMKSPTLMVAAILCALQPAFAAEPAPAFPDAEGFGRFASGGRGGEIVHVTTLADSGPGSFRAAVSQPHRVVVFDVGGIIRLKSNVAVRSHISLLGQTAPGDGVMLYGRSVSFSGQQDVIIRYLRFREGSAGDKGKCSVNIAGGSDMIFDHCSIEWGRWDCLGITLGSHDITVQNCIIGAGVAPQRFGALTDAADNITYRHNLWLDNQSRNPKAKGKIQFLNNVVYNWGGSGLVGGHSRAAHYLDLVGNYFIAGPDSGAHFVGEFKASDHVFQQDNLADLNRDGKLDGRAVVAADFGSGENAPTFARAPTVAPLAPGTVESAPAALAHVIASAGCSRHRDAVDARLIAEVQSLGPRGKIIRAEAEVGGPGELPEVHAPAGPSPPAD